MNRINLLIALVVTPILLFIASCSVEEKADAKKTEPKDPAPSVDIDTIPDCAAEGFALLDSIENGNFEALKTFIENGGDPMFQCYDRRRIGRPLERLVIVVNLSNSYEILEYYLKQGISAEWKEILLTYQTSHKDDEGVKLLVSNNAREEDDYNWCIPLDTARYNYLLKFDYDVNFIRPADTMTDFMHYAMCPCPNGAEGIIGSMKYLIRKGADPTIQSGSGKTALDFAKHPDIIAYLKGLE